ncbi:MAG: exostosin [Nitrospinae bacterium]|nr:exostosin [Nitrospinota bacterium]
MILKIFSDKSYLPTGKGHIAMLYPFWGKNLEDPRDPSSGRFDMYTKISSRFFQMTALKDADIAVFPAAWEHVVGNTDALKKAEGFIENATLSGKPTVIFFFSDSDEDIPYKNTIIFRTSLYRSRRKSNEFAMPAWNEDFIEKYLGGQLSIRQKQDKAIVGFCGNAPAVKLNSLPLRGILGHILYVGKHMVMNPRGWRVSDSFIRAAALKAMIKSYEIHTNFIIRNQFLGGAESQSGEMRFAMMNKTRQEYLQNMLESDYILCARGGGNYSYRLYETLSCGRPPLFIDTDCVLPYDFEINWKKYCIWVDWRDFKRIGEIVADFHEPLSQQDFLNLQKKCRQLWEDWLSPHGFFSNFYRHFIRA